tara:strand:+ start:206 stop:607 length:402 start_codon:yes stop_codon:yes gene_type:complete
VSPSVTQESNKQKVEDYVYTSETINDDIGLELNEDQRTELKRLMSMHRDVTEKRKELEGERLSLKTQILEVTGGKSIKIDNWKTWTVPIKVQRMFTKKKFEELYGVEWVRNHTNAPAEDEEKVRFYVKYTFEN